MANVTKLKRRKKLESETIPSLFESEVVLLHPKQYFLNKVKITTMIRNKSDGGHNLPPFVKKFQI